MAGGIELVEESLAPEVAEDAFLDNRLHLSDAIGRQVIGLVERDLAVVGPAEHAVEHDEVVMRGKPEVAQLIPDTALERSKHVQYGPHEGNADVQLPELKGDRELEQIAGRESPAAPTSLRILEVRHHDTFLTDLLANQRHLASGSGAPVLASVTRPVNSARASVPSLFGSGPGSSGPVGARPAVSIGISVHRETLMSHLLSFRVTSSTVMTTEEAGPARRAGRRRSRETAEIRGFPGPLLAKSMARSNDEGRPPGRPTTLERSREGDDACRHRV
jgi:hypothetical protein